MARRNRYRDLERKIILVILADLALFLLYLLFAGLGITPVKVICTILVFIASLLGLGFLFMSGELTKKRSLWMSASFASIILCTIVSLITGVPGPFVP